MPIVERLDKDGYRVWYDEGIAPIETWDDFIADKVINCEIMLTFISNNYISSNNCMDELNYARSKNKKILRVHIEKSVALPDGAEMRLERIQAVFRTDYKNENDFFQKLYLAKDMSACLKSESGKILSDIPINHQKLSFDTPKEVKRTKKPLNFEVWIDSLPGVRSNNILIRGFAIICYVLALLYLFSSFNDVGTSAFWGELSYFIFVLMVPFFCFSNYMQFQDRIWKKYGHKTKRVIFCILGALSMNLGSTLYNFLYK